MQVTLKLYGNLRRYADRRRETLEREAAPGTTVRVLLEAMGVPSEGVWMAAVNDQVVDVDTVLKEGDLVEIFEPVGGG